MSADTAERKRSLFREYFEALLIAGIFLGFTNTFVVKTFYIPSGSMKETLLIGDHLFVNRFIYGLSPTAVERTVMPVREIRRGDIVIFRSPESPTTDLVKRCIGLPGDRIRMERKTLYVNGEEVDDSAFTQHTDERVFSDQPSPFYGAQVRKRDNISEFTVPEGEFFFLGDNRDESYDSRFWGTVPRHYLKGRALMIYWSYEGETPDGEWHGWGQKLGQLARTAGSFFSETRWDRTFHLVR
ncbi:MAG: signal peptidase I [Acidobacteriota bacterium]